MTPILLFDSGCNMCTGMASRIETASEGRLRARPLDDPEMRALLDEHAPGWKRRPTLIMRNAGSVRVHTGTGLSLALLGHLGWARSRRVLGVVADMNTETASGSLTRRRIIGLAGAGALAVGFTAVPAAASEKSETLTKAQRDRILQKVQQREDVRAARDQIVAAGFSLDHSESVIVTGGRPGYLAMHFYGDSSNLEGRAAVLTHEFDGISTHSTAVEFITGSVDDLITESAYVLPHGKNAGPGDVARPDGAQEYISCLAACVGANCSAQAYKCRHLRIMYLVLACMVGICGSKVRTCHRVCKSKW